MEEFELTYLAKKELIPKLKSAPFKEVEDIYIPLSSKHPDLRIRKSGGKYEITKKQPVKEGDSSHQLETTIPLTVEEFRELSLLKGKIILKNRYLYKEGDFTCEVDVFQGSLAGLVLVDIEFKSSKEKDSFTPPLWVLADVTQEKCFAGGMLAGKSYGDIQEKLKKFGYENIKARP